MVLRIALQILALTLVSGAVLSPSAWCEYRRASCESPSVERLAPIEYLRQGSLDAEWQRTSAELKVYTPARDEARSQVILVPPIGGENLFDRGLAQALCLRGISVLILSYASSVPVVSLDLGVHDRAAEEFLAQLEKALRAHPRTTVLVGASLGGMFSSVAYGIAIRGGEIPGYKLSFPPEAITRWTVGAVLTAAGGPVSEIAATSVQDLVAKQRQLRMAEGMSLDEYQHQLRPAIHIDPVLLADPTRSSHILFFNSTMDGVVPARTQYQLLGAWGQPDGSFYTLGHRQTIMMVYSMQAERVAAFVKGH